MTFSVFVEALNIRAGRKRRIEPLHLRETIPGASVRGGH
jgi:hypothetical protein